MTVSDKRPRKPHHHILCSVVTALAVCWWPFAPVLARETPLPSAIELVPSPAHHRQSLGLPIIEPIRLLEVFIRLGPMLGAPIVFELRRPHPQLGERQVAPVSDVIQVAEKLDSHGLGLADLATIRSEGVNGRLIFEVDQRRLDIEGTEAMVAFALPLMDAALYTSPLDVVLTGDADHPVLQVTNRGAEAWLVTEIRLGEGRVQHLSKPLSGRIQPTDDGVTIVHEPQTIGLESSYDGLLPPGSQRHFDLTGPLPAGPSLPLNLVVYRLDDPLVLAGVYLLPKTASGQKLYQAAEPPWDQWQPAPMLLLGPWPPALIVVRQCDQPAP